MRLLRRLWFFVTRWRRMRDLDDEMRLHVELRAGANRQRGLAPAEAEREARRRFGNLLKLREESRDSWGFPALEQLAVDAWHGTRNVLRRPAWTLVVVSTLALGVGANTSIFTLIDTMLFKPAPWNTGGRLVWITSFDRRNGTSNSMSYPDYLAYRDRATTMPEMLAYSGNAVAVGGAPATRVNCGLVSGNYFDVLGIHAQMGRTFVPAEDGAPAAHPVAVLSDALWRAHFGADPTIVNTTVAINGVPFTIVGVAPRGFSGIAYADNAEDLWVPLAMEPIVIPGNPKLLTGDTRWVQVVGRLRDGRTAANADAEVRLIARQLNPPGTAADRERSARALPMRGGMTPAEQKDFAGMFALLAVVPVMVLLVACANVANVLMAQNAARRRELAMRRAVGASRSRLIRLLLMESLVIAVLATAAGFGLAFALKALVVHYGEVPADFSALLTPDRRALVATITVATMATVFSGLWPALTATKFNVLPVLKEEGPTSTDAGGRTRMRRAFVIVQVALSLTLVIVAGLFLQSLSKVIDADPGFDPHGLVTVSFDSSMLRYDAARQDAFITGLTDRASAIRGVISVSLIDILPLSGEMRQAAVVAEDQEHTRVLAVSAQASAQYFETMRLPIVRGREFTRADVTDATLVAIVNETLAKRLWPNGDALGKRVRIRDSQQPWRVVVGIARDAKYLFLTDPSRAAFCVPFQRDAASPASLVVRTVGDSRATLSSLSAIAHALDPNLPLFKAQTLDERIRQGQIPFRSITSLLSMLSALTLVLAAVGLYSVAAHGVSLRTREIGIRMSLGARGADVFRMVIGENFLLSLIGIAVGLGLGAGASRVVTSLLFGVSGAAPITFTLAATMLCLVAMIASYLPARWAARVDPLIALRHD